jgi:hypothetical protein
MVQGPHPCSLTVSKTHAFAGDAADAMLENQSLFRHIQLGVIQPFYTTSYRTPWDSIQ